MLVPVIGLVQVGSQAFADRYTYLPLIGCFILVVWGVVELVPFIGLGAQRALVGVAFCVLLACGLATFREALYWQNSEILFRRCLSVTKENHMAHNILGIALTDRGDLVGARAEFLEAIRIQPQYADALQNLGVVESQAGRFEEAKAYLAQAVQLKPTSAQIYAKLGFLLNEQGKTGAAIDFYRAYLRCSPDEPSACNNLAWILATHPDSNLRNGGEAVGWAEHACDVTHRREPVFVGTLAAAYAEAGRFQDAIAAAQLAINLSHAAGQDEVEKTNQRLLELYRAGKPFHSSGAGL